MRQYELTYLISDEVRETDLNKVTGKIAGFITDLKGKITKEDIWGRRKLVYPIRKQDFATYVTLYFSLPADKVKEFEREMHLESAVVRHLMLVKELGEEKISLTAEEIANAEDIQSVIGGEKSFEAIEGETEESRDLMAKREEKTEETEIEEAPVEKAEKETEEVIEEAQESVETPKEEKPVKVKEEAKDKPAKKVAKKKEPADEAERLSKLNEELDDILKDEL